MLVPIALSEELRTWKDSSGSFSIEAEFVSQDLTSVTLRTADQRDIAVPLARLSREDRQYLTQLKPRKLDRPKVQPSIANTLVSRLAKKADFQFSQTPLTEVLQAFRDDHGLPTIIDQRAIEEAGINISTSITYSQSKVSVGDALSKLLESVSLEWTTNRGVVFVTTRRGAEAHPSTYVYRMKSEANPAALMKDITESIDADSWQALGGPGMLQHLHPLSLIVSQRQAVHQQIVEKRAGDLTLVPHRPFSLSALQVEIPVASLLKPLSLSMTNQPLSQVATRMSDAAKTEIKIDDQALERLGLSRDTAITINLPELPLVDVASLVLEPLGLTLSIRGQEIYITTKQAASTHLLPASYKTGDFHPYSLGNVLLNLVSPYSWVLRGGTGSIKSVPGGSIEIQQTLDVHVEIAQLLSDL